MHIKTTLLSILFLFSIVVSSTTSAKIYKWVDASGKVHYTATPPPKTVKIKSEEEFKVRKTPKSSLTNRIRSNAGKTSPGSKKTAKKQSSKVNDPAHARSQCAKAISKTPALVGAIKRQLKQAISAGKVPESKMSEFERQQNSGKLKAPTMSACVKEYAKGGAAKTDIIADNNAADAIAWLQLGMAFGGFSR